MLVLTAGCPVKITVQELIDRGLLDWYQSWNDMIHVQLVQQPTLEVELSENQACIMGVQFCSRCEQETVNEFLKTGNTDDSRRN